jgi:hypothetical protein
MTLPIPTSRIVAALLALCSATAAPAGEILLQGSTHVIRERNVPMKARDGETLMSDVYRPEAPGKYPVILSRTPYDKTGEGFGPKAVENGYVFIVQDVRGRYTSGGEFYPLRHEKDDGYDAVEWAASLPYSNGKVGMYGLSYSAMTQLLAAVGAPPHLACIMPFVMASNVHEQWVYKGGAFSQALNQAWSTSIAINVLQRRVSQNVMPSHWDMKKPLISFPMLDVGTAAGLADFYYDWLRHPDYDAYWKEWSIEEHYSEIKVPSLHIGAWYDMFEEGPIRNFLGIRAKGGSEEARKGQHLLMEVGGHAGAGPVVGEVDFGKQSYVDTWDLALRWYDYIMKGRDNGIGSEAPIRVFLMGRNTWLDLQDWPAPGTKEVRYHLHSDGAANTAQGHGSLAEAKPGAEQPDRYTYDPKDPVPTTGGAGFGDATMRQGPVDQRSVEGRRDVLVYTSAPAAKDITLLGPVSLDLFVSSSAVDTDFTGKLLDVGPDGTARNLTEGILRARYRNSRERAEFLKPGEPVRITVDLGSTAHVFLPGHSIRVEVSSSNFPRFDRNLNTGADIAGASGASIAATNTVLHDSDHPSALVARLLPE